MDLTGKWILVGAALLGAFLLWRPAPRDDIHAEVQQRLLEAELGSATTFHFAAWSRDLLPDASLTGTLLNDLRAAHPETRWQAAKQLAVRRDPQTVEAVIRAMLDPAGTGRVCVMASVLGHLQDPRALGALTEAAFDPGNRDLRLCAIQSLGMIGDRRAVPALIEAIRSGNNPVSAANAIARMGDERGVQPVIEAAADPQLRLFMARALGELGSTAAVSYLSSLADDPTPAIRQAALEARWKIGLLSTADPVPTLSAVISEEAMDARRMWAAFRLGEFRQPKAIPGLIVPLT
jgi:HEAT repeat protein